MSTTAQIEANRENAQHSTGPVTNEGKAASSRNNHRHGLAGGLFFVLPWEEQERYNELLISLLLQHQPQTGFEETLVGKIAQHFWLSQRAVRLQELCFAHDVPFADNEDNLKLYMRYQATHDRAYHKLSGELRSLRNETRKTKKDEAAHLSEPKIPKDEAAHLSEPKIPKDEAARLSEPKIQAIGFESQDRAHPAETRRQAAESRTQNEEMRRATAEIRKSELHTKRLALLDAQIERLAKPAPAALGTKSAAAAPKVAQNPTQPRSQAA